jgi:hypothetical protein
MKLDRLALGIYILFLVVLVAFLLNSLRSIEAIVAAQSLFIRFLVVFGAGSILWSLGYTLLAGRQNPGFDVPQRAVKIILLAFAGLILVLPLSGLLSAAESRLPDSENRRLAALPHFKMAAMLHYLNDYSGYFDDNFGFRKTWMSLNNLWHVRYFKVSPLPSVIVGQDGWFFYQEGLDDTRGLTTFSPEQLTDITARMTKQTEWAQKQGIYYLIVICPDKESIYPEYLPDNVQLAISNTNKLDQLMAFPGLPSRLNILDLREPLRKAKDSGQLYYRTDTHWNSHGAFIGYQAIMQNLCAHFPELQPPVLADYRLQEKASLYSGDLMSMLSTYNQINELSPTVSYQPGANAPPPQLGRAVIFRDSYYDQLEPYFKSDFAQIQDFSQRDEFNPQSLETDPPDVIMLICVQRQISLIQSLADRCLPLK